MVDGPGEYDVKEHTISGIPVKNGDQLVTIYYTEVEGIRILNLTHIKKLNLTQDELEDIGEVDILIVPIGAGDVLDFEEAAKTVNLIEPKIVIPSHYKIPGLSIKADSDEKFIKQMGGKSEKLEKLSIKKKELPLEGTKLIILEPLR